MRKNVATFLQILTVLIGITIAVLMLLLPLHEGRNVNATLFQVYFRDPFLAYVYAVSTAFFVALYQILRLLKYSSQSMFYSSSSLKALRTIKYCTLSLIAFIIPPVAYLFIAKPEDDIAGGVAMGLFLIVIFATCAAAATLFQKRITGTFT